MVDSRYLFFSYMIELQALNHAVGNGLIEFISGKSTRIMKRSTDTCVIMIILHIRWIIYHGIKKSYQANC